MPPSCEVKLLELRDAATFIPVMAIRLAAGTSQERYLLRRAGYAGERIDSPDGPHEPYVILCKLDGVEAQYDAFGWPGRARTLPVAHNWIIAHWRELSSGDVVDVQFILGETAAPKVSERVTHAV